MKKTILITGSEGFIGSHLVESLILKKYKVICFCLYNSFNSWGWLNDLKEINKKDLNIFLGDIRDKELVDSVVKKSDNIIHLASLISIPYSYRAAESYVDFNIKGTLNILESAKKYKIKKIVHISTSETYGSAQFVPINEDHPLNAQSPYAATKIAADQLALSYHKSFDLPVAIARPFNTYGPRQSLRAIIPTILMQIINGKSISLGSTSPMRDFNFVSDTVDGIISVLEKKESIGDIFNIGNGYEISINDLVKLCLDVTKCTNNVVSEKKRVRPDSSEVNRLLCCNKKAKKILGWKPKYIGNDGLKDGIKIFYNWLKLNKDKYFNTSEFYE